MLLAIRRRRGRRISALICRTGKRSTHVFHCARQGNRSSYLRRNVTPQREPLGILDAWMWARENKAETGQRGGPRVERPPASFSLKTRNGLNGIPQSQQLILPTILTLNSIAIQSSRTAETIALQVQVVIIILTGSAFTYFRYRVFGPVHQTWRQHMRLRERMRRARRDMPQNMPRLKTLTATTPPPRPVCVPLGEWVPSLTCPLAAADRQSSILASRSRPTRTKASRTG
ncbi:hypothetical protein CJO78_18815 (plasmid) [Ralstonia solanacearum]|nr:hypothetical protein CJO78_18815 [Ralstonia solanacearum]AXW07869.1 hypothetical protein CJO82_18470 [Ralstonia solanacearum]AXW25662.1 hypothetical protein CJO86_18725 [Ralstonia solanacearum]AXW82570.1 hypothetical protein CJO98_18830 [Ralstonia solanacearum]